ncbi:predicted protein [Pyrenophora tritici-repentis Pt-1C-BFP]|uniref:Uncharacterized protein n=1 Tax=Pyrenophora tritici-repentis (strain Pt-1C-BFP) TaxID=426418 RepID=B2VT09_PYRTR|nr:uncharacterized protein PTRG_01845 [Pyrenophora tritici-repentis Pt-1C-BFP]EDU41283.1 predicted protein [Pyrenophora tritici-repentis Pt-1C-BFP]
MPDPTSARNEQDEVGGQKFNMGTHMHIELKPVRWVPAAVPNAPEDMHGQSWPLVPCYPAAVAVTGQLVHRQSTQVSQDKFWNRCG